MKSWMPLPLLGMVKEWSSILKDTQSSDFSLFSIYYTGCLKPVNEKLQQANWPYLLLHRIFICLCFLQTTNNNIVHIGYSWSGGSQSARKTIFICSNKLDDWYQGPLLIPHKELNHAEASRTFSYRFRTFMTRCNFFILYTLLTHYLH